MVIVTTGKGDDGTTSLFTPGREYKDHLIFQVLGDLDELVSHLGVARTYQGPEGLDFLQDQIFKFSALLASDPDSEDYPGALIESWNLPAQVQRLETSQEQLQSVAPIPERFIIPGEAGHRGAAHLDVARAVSRRAERSIVQYRRQSGRKDLEVMGIWINRVSDYLFVLARYWEFTKLQEK